MQGAGVHLASGAGVVSQWGRRRQSPRQEMKHRTINQDEFPEGDEEKECPGGR